MTWDTDISSVPPFTLADFTLHLHYHHHLHHHHHHHISLSLSSHNVYPSSSHHFLFTYPYYIDLYSYHSFLFIHPSIYPLTCLSIRLIYLSTYLYVYLHIYLCAYLYIYLPMICMTMSRDEFVENTRNRLVTIVGTSVCAQRAHLLINQRLQVNKSIHQSMN